MVNGLQPTQEVSLNFPHQLNTLKGMSPYKFYHVSIAIYLLWPSAYVRNNTNVYTVCATIDRPRPCVLFQGDEQGLFCLPRIWHKCQKSLERLVSLTN